MFELCEAVWICNTFTVIQSNLVKLIELYLTLKLFLSFSSGCDFGSSDCLCLAVFVRRWETGNMSWTNKTNDVNIGYIPTLERK